MLKKPKLGVLTSPAVRSAITSIDFRKSIAASKLFEFAPALENVALVVKG
jgi:hypothetical protein